jgi:flagellar hook assembly protein FlgD
VGSIIPKEYSLLQNYPNPGNPSTQIRFDVPEATKVRLLVYDILGRIVKVLVDAELSAGSYIVTWDGTEENKHQVSSGMYLYRLWTDKFNNTKKLLILK